MFDLLPEDTLLELEIDGEGVSDPVTDVDSAATGTVDRTRVAVDSGLSDRFVECSCSSYGNGNLPPTDSASVTLKMLLD